jgi:hypothetical protein
MNAIHARSQLRYWPTLGETLYCTNRPSVGSKQTEVEHASRSRFTTAASVDRPGPEKRRERKSLPLPSTIDGIPVEWLSPDVGLPATGSWQNPRSQTRDPGLTAVPSDGLRAGVHHHDYDDVVLNPHSNELVELKGEWPLRQQ